MKTIYLVMMALRGERNWSPVSSWESKKSAIKSIKRGVEQDKLMKFGSRWKYTIKEVKLFLDLEIPY